MAAISLFRGGVPTFRPAFCCGDYPRYDPFCQVTHYAGTPPFDTHPDAAHGQGYNNLTYPLVPNLLETDTHRWMRTPLQKLSAVGDTLDLIWIPTYSYVDSLCIVLTQYDAILDGVYVQPIAKRYWWNPATKQCEYKDNTAFDVALGNYANAVEICLGTPAEGSGDTAGDSPYIFARFPQVDSDLPWSFGHDLYKRNDNDVITGPLDDYTGIVTFGLKITKGEPDAIKNIWRGKFELWITLKALCHDCAGFTG